MTTNTPENFYVTGGTLRRDTPSYVARRADEELYDGLRQGQFCYVLTSRQMGKSSLMVQTAARLREEGATVAVLDLTAIGQNLTAEQWYDDLLGRLAEQVGLEAELEEFWLAHERLGPLARWMRALTEVVLPRRAGQVVIFVDEIDAVRSLPFSTDEFFAAIRELYNRRTAEPGLARLTFCLLGVATPSDLIRDTRTTPFNIGRRIELNDFTEAEAAPLARGLGRDEATADKLLHRILYWTGGHPYLTQRLCQAVADDQAVKNAGGVDRLCEELFFSTRARERDDNLLFVRERLLRSEADTAGLLDLYSQVRRHKRVRDDETNPLVSVLRLSGVARVVEGLLYVRNRIYYRVFDQEWVIANLPDAELQRQHAAYRRGLMRAAAIAAVIILAFAALTALAFQARNSAREEARRADSNQRQAEMNAQQMEKQRLEAERQRGLAVEQQKLAEQQRVMADQERLEAERQKTIAEEQRQIAQQQTQEALFQKASAEEQRNLALQQEYTTRMIVANQAFESNNLSRVDELLNAYLPRPGQPDPRGFEWYYLWRNFHQESFTLGGHDSAVNSIAFSPNGKVLGSAGADKTIKLWNAMTGQLIATLDGHTNIIRSVAFSPDGKTLASGSEDKTIKLWNAATGKLIATLDGHLDAITSVTFSPDGKTLASGSDDKTIRLWNTATTQLITTLSGHTRDVTSVAFSPDGKTLASGCVDTTVKLWDVATGQLITTLSGHTNFVLSLAFSPDGKMLASGSQDKTIRLWSVATGQPITTLSGHARFVTSVTFSPDGKTLASGSFDNTIKLWNATTGQSIATLSVHSDSISSVAFAPDGKTLASGSADTSIKLWNVAGQSIDTLSGYTASVASVAFSSDGKTLASGSGNTIKLWNVATGQPAGTLSGSSSSIFRYDRGAGSDLSLALLSPLAFAPDGRTLASHRGNTIKLWNVATGQPAGTLSMDMDTGSIVRRIDLILSLAFAPNGKTLASSSNSGDITIWNVVMGQPIATLGVPTDASFYLSVAFSPDGKTLASGSEDKTIKLWNVVTGQHIITLSGHTGFVFSVAFAPDGKTLASGSFDKTIKLWNVATGQPIVTLRGHTDAVTSVAFSPDGKTLASGSDDKTIRLWNVATGQPIGTLSGHTGKVTSVVFAPNGKMLASGSADKTIRLWRAATEEEVQRTMRREQTAQR